MAWAASQVGRVDGVMPDADSKLERRSGGRRVNWIKKTLAEAETSVGWHLAEGADFYAILEHLIVREDGREEKGSGIAGEGAWTRKRYQAKPLSWL